MKLRKIAALTASAVLSLTTLSVLPAGAADDVLGDVDQDGVITGHDSAMVSRYLNVDANALTEEQLALADMNGDGTVDQTDADLIHENEVYAIGNISGKARSYGSVELYSAYGALVYYAAERAGVTVTVTDADMQALSATVSDTIKESGMVNQLVYHLIDTNGDGEVTIEDASALLTTYSIDVVESTQGEFYVNGRYDLVWDVLAELPYVTGDAMDGIGL